MKKRLFVGVWFLFFLFSCKTSEHDQAKKKNGDEALFQKPILYIDHKSLTNEDLKNFIKIQYPDLTEKKDDQKMLSRLFDLFIKHQLILYEADKEKLTISEDEYVHYLKTAEIAKNGSATERRSIEDFIKVQKYLMLRVYKDSAVSEKEIENYYQAHIENYRKKDEIYLHQILIDNREKAIKIRGDLVNSPGKFEEIAGKTSASPDAQTGGSMGYFEKGVLPKEMEDVVFSLKIDEISPVVESAYGFHIFKVTQKKGQRLLTMAMVRNEIENMLLSEKFNSAYDRFLQQIKDERQPKAIYDNLYFTYQTSNTGEPNESKN